MSKADGRTFLGQSTYGWKLCVIWKEGSIYWKKISDVMDYHPLATDEYAVSQSLDHEPEFKWWVTFVLKNCVGIIPLVKQRSAGYLKRKKRYGIIPPRTVEEA